MIALAWQGNFPDVGVWEGLNLALLSTERLAVSAIKVLLRGRAHSEWKVLVSGERRTVRDDQVFVEDKQIIWGKGIFNNFDIFHLIGHYGQRYLFFRPHVYTLRWF